MKFCDFVKNTFIAEFIYDKLILGYFCIGLGLLVELVLNEIPSDQKKQDGRHASTLSLININE